MDELTNPANEVPVYAEVIWARVGPFSPVAPQFVKFNTEFPTPAVD